MLTPGTSYGTHLRTALQNRRFLKGYLQIREHLISKHCIAAGSIINNSHQDDYGSVLQVVRRYLTAWSACEKVARQVYSLQWKRSVKRMATAAPRSLYDVLGVTAQATQKEIKSAYYELSKTYHPDRNKSSVETSQKFREVNQAYEILGNFANRRKYDRGMLTTDLQGTVYEGTHPASARDDVRAENFYKNRHFRSRAPPPSGRTPIYDFDEWTEMHYSDTFRHRKQAQERRSYKAHSEEVKLHVRYAILCTISGFMMLLGITFMEHSYLNENLRRQKDRK